MLLYSPSHLSEIYLLGVIRHFKIFCYYNFFNKFQNVFAEFLVPLHCLYKNKNTLDYFFIFLKKIQTFFFLIFWDFFKNSRIKKLKIKFSFRSNNFLDKIFFFILTLKLQKFSRNNILNSKHFAKIKMWEKPKKLLIIFYEF